VNSIAIPNFQIVFHSTATAYIYTPHYPLSSVPSLLTPLFIETLAQNSSPEPNRPKQTSKTSPSPRKRSCKEAFAEEGRTERKFSPIAIANDKDKSQENAIKSIRNKTYRKG
jgi:hypothetical protein